MDITSLLNQEEQLQKEAQKVQEEINLFPILSQYGKPLITGSVALKVMVRRDIDIEVIVDGDEKEKTLHVMTGFAKLNLTRIDFTLIDHRSHENDAFPKGVLIGIKYAGKDAMHEKFRDNPNVWQFDIWFLHKENSVAGVELQRLLSLMTPEKREIILKLKSELMEKGIYRKTISGIDIYRAVLLKDVVNLEELQKLNP